MVVLGSNECHVSVSLFCLFVLDTKMLIAVDLKKKCLLPLLRKLINLEIFTGDQDIQINEDSAAICCEPEVGLGVLFCGGR